MFRSTLVLIFTCLMLLSSEAVMAKVSFSDYVQQLKKQALEEGFSQEFVDEQFPQIKLFKRAHASKSPELDASGGNQSQQQETLETFLPKVVPQQKSDRARALYKVHHSELQRMGDKYGVQPRFILALWGMVANFDEAGHQYPILSVLASLAYENQGNSLYQQEFLAALKVLEQSKLDFRELTGSRQGTIGIGQFPASFYLKYAKDGNEDGVIDLWADYSDLFASLANFLSAQGWNSNLTWGRQVKIVQPIKPEFIGIDKSKTLAQWQLLGVRRYSGKDLPAKSDLHASLIAPDGEKGRYYLVYDNYRSILNWQDSNYFAISVVHLSEKIKYPKIALD